MRKLFKASSPVIEITDKLLDYDKVHEEVGFSISDHHLNLLLSRQFQLGHHKEAILSLSLGNISEAFIGTFYHP